jgi:hypothetical protein
VHNSKYLSLFAGEKFDPTILAITETHHRPCLKEGDETPQTCCASESYPSLISYHTWQKKIIWETYPLEEF